MSNPARARRRRSKATLCPNPDPIVRLWLLRILVPLGGRKEFATKEGVNDEALAKSLGLEHWLDLDDAAADLLDWQPRDSHFDLRRFVAELRGLHAKAEVTSSGLGLPEPLQRNVAELADLLCLSRADAAVLAFAVVLHGDNLLQRTADSLGFDLSFTQVSHVLAVILALPEAEVRAALHPRSMLARAGLLTLDRQGTNSLRRALDLLSSAFAEQMFTSEAHPAELLRGKINLSAPGHLPLEAYTHVGDSLRILRPYLRSVIGSARRGVNILVHGGPGTGKTQLTKTLAADLGCTLFEVASEDEDGDPIAGERRLRAFRAAQCFLAGQQALLVFDEAEDVFSAGEDFHGLARLLASSTAQRHKGWFNRALEDGAVPALWLANSIVGLDPAFVRRFDMVFEVPVPPRKQREGIVREACGDILDHAGVARLAEIETLAPAVVTRAAAVVQAVSAQLGEEFDAGRRAGALEHLIDNTLHAQGHAGLALARDRSLPVYDPAFIQADADLALVAQGIARARSARMCLYGPPGTGKTAYARWLADQLGSPLLVQRASDLISKWVGQSEKNIAQAFRQAEREGAVLLIDEVDSFLQDRRDANRSWEVTQVNEMLTQMESFTGVFIASTNLMEDLDQAALRRFDLKVRFDFLAPGQAEGLLHRHCSALGLPAPDDAARAAVRDLRQLTPGDFAAAIRQHRFYPVGSPQQLVDILRGECALKQGSRNAIGFLH